MLPELFRISWQNEDTRKLKKSFTQGEVLELLSRVNHLTSRPTALYLPSETRQWPEWVNISSHYKRPGIKPGSSERRAGALPLISYDHYNTTRMQQQEGSTRCKLLLGNGIAFMTMGAIFTKTYPRNILVTAKYPVSRMIKLLMSFLPVKAFNDTFWDIKSND